MNVGLKSLELGHSLRIFPQPPCTRLFEPFLVHVWQRRDRSLSEEELQLGCLTAASGGEANGAEGEEGEAGWLGDGDGDRGGVD